MGTSLLYVAVSVCVPWLVNAQPQLPLPAASVAVQVLVLPSLKVTVPVGVGPPELVTVADSVARRPICAVPADEPVVVVATWRCQHSRARPELDAFFESPGSEIVARQDLTPNSPNSPNSLSEQYCTPTRVVERIQDHLQIG